MKLLALFSSKLAKVLEPDSAISGLEKKGHVPKKMSESSSSKVILLKEIKVVAWIAGFMALIYIVGTLPAIVLFVFLFLKFYGGKSLLTSVAFTVATWLFVYILFARILHVRFYTGMLGFTL
jgi:hypothetical protein